MLNPAKTPTALPPSIPGGPDYELSSLAQYLTAQATRKGYTLELLATTFAPAVQLPAEYVLDLLHTGHWATYRPLALGISHFLGFGLAIVPVPNAEDSDNALQALVTAELEARKLPKAGLARLLGVTPPMVTKLYRNTTGLSRIAQELGYAVEMYAGLRKVESSHDAPADTNAEK